MYRACGRSACDSLGMHGLASRLADDTGLGSARVAVGSTRRGATRAYIASRRRARRSPRAAGGLGTCLFREGGRLRGWSAFRHPHWGTSVALLPGTRLAHSSDPSGHSSYGLTKSLGEGDILVASKSCYIFFARSEILPEVREFIKDTRPKTNTTRGGFVRAFSRERFWRKWFIRE